MQLLEILVTMQREMIQTLQGLVFSNNPTTNVDYISLLELSNRSRLDSISALTQQYQRFRVAAPIAREMSRIEGIPFHTSDISKPRLTSVHANKMRASSTNAPARSRLPEDTARGLKAKRNYHITNSIAFANEPWISGIPSAADGKRDSCKDASPIRNSRTYDTQKASLGRDGSHKPEKESPASTHSDRETKDSTPTLRTIDRPVKPLKIVNRSDKTSKSKDTTFALDKDDKQRKPSSPDSTTRKPKDSASSVKKTSKQEECSERRKPSECSLDARKSSKPQDSSRPTDKKCGLKPSGIHNESKEISIPAVKTRKDKKDPSSNDSTLAAHTSTDKTPTEKTIERKNSALRGQTVEEDSKSPDIAVVKTRKSKGNAENTERRVQLKESDFPHNKKTHLERTVKRKKSALRKRESKDDSKSPDITVKPRKPKDDPEKTDTSVKPKEPASPNADLE
jgi:hypothetical protein